MPRYDFYCKKCKRIKELTMTMDEYSNTIVICEICEAEMVQKLNPDHLPTFIIGVGSDTRLSDIAPDENASEEVKTKFKKMLKIKKRNPLNILSEKIKYDKTKKEKII